MVSPVGTVYPYQVTGLPQQDVSSDLSSPFGGAGNQYEFDSTLLEGTFAALQEGLAFSSPPNTQEPLLGVSD